MRQAVAQHRGVHRGGPAAEPRLGARFVVVPRRRRLASPSPSPSVPSTSRSWSGLHRLQRIMVTRTAGPTQSTTTTPTCTTSCAPAAATGTCPTTCTRSWRRAAAGAVRATRPRPPASTAGSSSTLWPRSWTASAGCPPGRPSRAPPREAAGGRRRRRHCCGRCGRRCGASVSRWRRTTRTPSPAAPCGRTWPEARRRRVVPPRRRDVRRHPTNRAADLQDLVADTIHDLAAGVPESAHSPRRKLVF
ncbi:unnamed protein product [Musa acuminata subsp. burmannicoides]